MIRTLLMCWAMIVHNIWRPYVLTFTFMTFMTAYVWAPCWSTQICYWMYMGGLVSNAVWRGWMAS